MENKYIKKSVGDSKHQTRFITRPTVMKKVYQGPSKEAAREYNSLKREFNSLFAEFSSDAREIQCRRLSCKINKAKRERSALLKKSQALLSLVRVGVSFADKMRIGAQPDKKAVSGLPVKQPKFQHDISRYQARRDYTRALRVMNEQKLSALALVKAIAARHPKVIYPSQKDKVVLVKDTERLNALRALARERRYLARHPAKMVSNFPINCYYPRYISEDVEEKIQIVDNTKRIFSTSIKQVKQRCLTRYWQSEKYISNMLPKKIIPQKSWDVEELRFLLFKLRLRIRMIRDSHSTLEWVEKIMSREVPKPQMDTAGVIEKDSESITKSGNVVIESSGDEERGTSHQKAIGFSAYSVSRENQIFSTLTDRWQFIKQFPWGKQGFNERLFALDFPYELLKNYPNTQTAQLLLNHRLFRTSFKFKLVLNSSPFQVGLAIVDWCYGMYDDTKDVRHVISAMHRNHARLSLGSSNNAIIDVPYHNFNSYMSNASKQCVMGTLSCRVLNPLAASDKVASSASISLYISLYDVEVRGLIERSIGLYDVSNYDQVQGQMNTIGSLCNIGSNVLRTAGQIMNQDKPPMALQPTALVPQTVQSFCYTDNIEEPLNVLRSDPLGQRQPPLISQDMDMYKIARGWGFINTIPWEFGDVHGKELYTQKVMPIMHPKQYMVEATAIQGMYAARVPPVAFVSSFASKVRGDLEYRFEIVANSFYTGALHIATIPIDRSENRTIDQASASSSFVLDIQQTSQMDIVVPWNWYNAWMRTRGIYSDGNCYAHLYVKVLNQLVGIDNVPPKIYINIYMRAGTNFEITQLRTPLFARWDEVIRPPVDEYLTPYNFETKWYTTTNKDIPKMADGRTLPTIYIQNVVNGWVGYTNVEPFVVYRLLGSTNKNRGFRCALPNASIPGVVGYVGYGVYHEALSTANAHGLVVFPRKEQAEYAAQTFKSLKYTVESTTAIINRYPVAAYTSDGDWSQIQIGNRWVEADNKPGEHPVWIKTIERLAGQMDIQGQSIVTEDQAPLTVDGLRIYGESMPDCKGMARRWQVYGSYIGKTCNEKYPRDCVYLFKHPVCPSRTLEPMSSKSYDNRVRDGAISMLNRVFLYWDGGMRYRYIVSHSVPEDTILYVQHRFDDESTEQTIITGDRVRTMQDLLDTHYPTFVQALSVNPVLSVEVPYSRSEERLLNTSRLRPMNNGFIYVWAHSSVVQDIHIEIYYSVADDFQWSVFQGIPAILDITQITSEPNTVSEEITNTIEQAIEEEQTEQLQGQMDNEAYYCDDDALQRYIESRKQDARVKQFIDNNRPQLKRFFKDDHDELEEEEESPKPQIFGGVGNAIRERLTLGMLPPSDRINDSLTAFDNAAVTISESAAKVSENFAQMSNKFQTFVDTVNDVPTTLSQAQKDRVERGHLSSFFSDLKNASFDYMTHLVYCAISPTGKTIAWAMVNLYRNVWGFTFDGISTLTSSISSLWTRSTQATQQPQPVGQMEDTDISSLCSILYCSMCTLLKLSVKPPTKWSNISEGLFEFGKQARVGSFVGMFIRDNITLLKRIWNKILSLFSIGTPNYKLIAGISDDRVRQWCVHSTSITNPNVRELVYTNPLWAEKVFELSIVGRGLALVLSQDKSTPVQILRLVNTNLVEIKKMEQDLVNRKVFCGERYEPYCLWLAGPPGSGKSRLCQEVAEQLADMAGYKGSQTYHTITVNQQYFDGYIGQPSIVIDDFLAVSPTIDTAANMFLQMKSCALFNPPYSDVKDKARVVNFQNLVITSNTTKVSNIPGIHDDGAYNRRRDLVLSILPSNKKASFKEYTQEEFERMEHCNVFVVKDPLDCKEREQIKRVEGENYKDTVLDYIRLDASNYHKRELLAFRQRSQKKIERLERDLEGRTSLQEYLLKCEENFKASPGTIDMLSFWKVDRKDPLLDKEEPSTSNTEVVAPQGDWNEKISKNHWPYIFAKKQKVIYPESVSSEMTDFSTLPEGRLFEPVVREEWWSTYKGGNCLHTDIIQPEVYSYDHVLKCFVHLQSFTHQDKVKIPYSFPVGPCTLADGKGGFKENPECCLHNEDSHFRFISKMTASYVKDHPSLAAIWPEDISEYIANCEDFPQEWLALSSEYSSKISNQIRFSLYDYRLARKVAKIQETMQKEVEILDEVIVPRESRWKSIPKMVWRGLVKTARWIYKVFLGLDKLVQLLLGLTMLGIFTSVLPFPGMPNSIPQIHPSGDFKTIRSQKLIRNKALSMVKDQGPGQSAYIEEMTDENVLKACQTQFIDPDSDGRLRRIISNVFTLVGIKELEKGNIVYRARCIGLRNYDFIAIRHYIEYFRTMGVTKVMIVRRGGIGIQTFQLDDLKFEWTDQGYGIGTFPTLARPFKKITSYIPSESFNGGYPHNMVMITVNADEVITNNLECVKLQNPKYIPKNGGQSAWTIKQGFNYSWGGAGKCGSFLFAPRMDCPFVGIHTAGVGDHTGYGEILLRETFMNIDIPEVDFVVPQMDINDNGFQIEGDHLLIGHLKKEKAVNLPTVSKIVPSEISGVFPVMTEPAPLSAKDERLPLGSDPLVEGLKKRCDSPKEFPIDVLDMAFMDYRAKLFHAMKPVRTPGVLTVTQAIEGFKLEGYEPLAINTSEGYPWVLDRPKTAHNKSWMFEFSEYPDGRRKLEGINRQLSETLKMKDRMREQFIVPATYYTACLKDARIAKEKVSTPGKTRMFEMSPVDLTISQRQYFLDFYASYQNTRLEAEHTVGINPDGPEWTTLATRLLEWSPHILTADYSGYGPRLHQSVQFRAYMVEISWYVEWAEKMKIPNDQIDREFAIRWTMLYEMLHPYNVVKDAVVQFNTGMPSGNAATVIKNSECNSIYIRVVYYLLAKQYAPQFADFYWFDRFVLMFSNGDDLIISVKEDIIKWFNNRTLIEKFAEFGIKMTDALKSGVVREFCSLEEATYLKRGFQPHSTRDGQWMAPLEEASITDTANWIWKSTNDREASLTNSEMCARLAYTRGEEFYNKIISKLYLAWKEKGVLFKAPSWKSLDMHVWENTEGPRFLFEKS